MVCDELLIITSVIKLPILNDIIMRRGFDDNASTMKNKSERYRGLVFSVELIKIPIPKSLLPCKHTR